MKLKTKELVLGVIVIFALGFLVHNLYELFNTYVFSILAPVNESVWEHMKIFFTSVIIYAIIESVIAKGKLDTNFLLGKAVAIIVMIVVNLLTFYPVYLAIGENFFVTILFYFIAILVGQYCSYIVRDKVKTDYSSFAFFLLISLLTLFLLFTYFPPKLDLFKDPITKRFGI